MCRNIVSQKEYDMIYAALKLIENLYKQGLIKQYIYRNILADYKDIVDIREFEHTIHNNIKN